MEEHPDSALHLINGIKITQMRSDKEKAQYSLLKSMALDKNYIDTTTFDVLQPAIDFYLRNGNSNEKLRTYYYQGRIYQNRGQRIFPVGGSSSQPYCVASLNMKNRTSHTPRSWLRNALILALNDSAEALVNRSSK